MGYSYISFRQHENDNNKTIMLNDVKNCEGHNLVIREGFHYFDFSLLTHNINITKITLPRSFTSLSLIPIKDNVEKYFSHIEEIVVPCTVEDIDFLHDNMHKNDYPWPRLTLEKRNKKYFQYEHGIYDLRTMSLLYIDHNYTGDFLLFFNTRNISLCAFRNKKIISLTVPSNLDLGHLFTSYTGKECYLSTCKRLKKVDIKNPSCIINKSWFPPYRNYDLFQKTAIALYPGNLSVDDKRFILPSLLQVFATPEGVKAQNKEAWFKYIKDNISKFNPIILSDSKVLDFLLNEGLLKTASVMKLITVAQEENSPAYKDALYTLTKYKEQNISEKQLEKYKEKQIQNEKRLEEIKKINEENKKEREKQAAIRKNYQCHMLKNSIEIANYKGTELDIVIPQYLNSKLVTSIGCKAFSPTQDAISNEQRNIRNRIRSISLPDSITNIDDEAFSKCSSLKRIKLPSSIILGSNFIPKSIFSGCVNLEEIEIPEGITQLYPNALSFNEHIKKITLPSSLKIIGNYAFSHCRKLEIINIPNAVEEINSSAFAYCSSLRTIVLPSSVKELPDNVFYNCENLETIVILNPNLKIGENLYKMINDRVCFVAEDNSTAISYAKKYNIAYSTDVEFYKDILDTQK